ncbi:hypothetical protein GCM10027570_08590 [Streptomonospora sediminis]
MHLVEPIKAGDIPGVLKALHAMTPEQRAACAPDLAATRETICAGPSVRRTDEVRTAHGIAELGCQPSPEALIASWHLLPDFPLNGSRWARDLANLFPTAWQTELVARMGAGPQPPQRPHHWFVLAEHIIRSTGCPIPASDFFLRLWLENRQSGNPLALLLDGAGTPGADLRERLRDDDFSPALLPLAVERPTIPIAQHHRTFADLAADGVIDRAALIRRTFADMAAAPESWPIDRLAYLALTAEEHARMTGERVEIVGRLLACLLKSGTPAQTRLFIRRLRALAPTAAENAVFLREHVAMLDLSPPVAGYAHQALIGVDEAEPLDPGVLTEISEHTLLRPQKKPVRTQLAWLNRVARRDPARAGRVLADAAVVFRHPDAALQERALDLVARHLPNAGADVLPELRAAAEALDPSLAARAAELLGTPQAGGAGQ